MYGAENVTIDGIGEEYDICDPNQDGSQKDSGCDFLTSCSEGWEISKDTGYLIADMLGGMAPKARRQAGAAAKAANVAVEWA